MGRLGVSYLEIADCAAELQSKGINPTVDNVRAQLGTGSRSTIGPYLKRWRNQQEEGGYLPGIPTELSSMVKGLYARLQEEALANMPLPSAPTASSIESSEKNKLLQQEIMFLKKKLRYLENRFLQMMRQNNLIKYELKKLYQNLREQKILFPTN